MNNENFDLVTNDENEEFIVEFGEVINDGGTFDYNELDNKPKINGNTVEGNKTTSELGIPVYSAGENITISDDYVISATGGGGGTSDYEDLNNLPSINNVELKGNKSLNDLGIQPKGNYLTTETDPIFNASASAGITSSDISNWNSKQDKKTKTITHLDARWHSRWIDCSNGSTLNLAVDGDGRLSMTPIWITSGTVLNVNTAFYTAAKAASARDAYVDIEYYNPGSSSANARGWVRKIRTTMQSAGNITLNETGYYVITAYNCVASKEPLWDYGYPYTFSYEVDEDFEVNYVNTVDWGTKDIVFVTNGHTQPTFSNGLNWACRREPGQPYYLSISGPASEYDRGCYQYTTNDFSGTRSSTSRQAIFVYGDEIWYFSPSIDGHVGISSISKFKIYDNGWIEYIGHCWHNLGHMNAVGYEKETDTFIWGNGSSSYVLEGEGYILNNFSTSKLATSYRDEIVLMTDMDINTGSFPIATYGFKLNVIPYKASCNNNTAPYNLYVAMVTNDGNTVRFGKIVADSSGKYLWANCTWENPTNIGDITETQTQSYEHCTQGMTILNGHVIMGEGHTKPQIATIWNNTVETMRTVCLLSQFSDSAVTCVATYKGKLIYCSSYEWIFTDITSLNNGISEDKIDEIIDEQVDLSGYQTLIDSSNKLSSDLVDDTNKINKFVTTTEKQKIAGAVQHGDDALGQALPVDADTVKGHSEETWTFVLADDTVVTKKVMAWTSAE